MQNQFNFGVKPIETKTVISILLVLTIAFFLFSFFHSIEDTKSSVSDSFHVKAKYGILKSELDIAITNFCQQFSRKSKIFDEFVVFVSNNTFLKGGVITIVFWFLWFRKKDSEESARLRTMIILAIISSFFAILAGRLLVMGLPFRARPLHTNELGLLLPYGVVTAELDKLSSFPSDHAVLFFAMATGLFYVSRKVGILALAYTIIFIAMPRIYLGYHYTTDVLLGGMVGSSITVFICSNKWLHQIGVTIYQYSKKRPDILDLFHNS